ncbi:MAG: hypothetical protein IJ867_06845 [Clostridia bacterium]|nr:hypothetical protein [Clostridia bacterium]
MAVTLVILLGTLVPYVVFAEGMKEACFILVGGDGDELGNKNNLFYQTTASGKSLYNFYDIIFIEQQTSNDPSSELYEKLQKTSYDNYIIAGFSHGGLSIFDNYQNLDKRITKIALIDAITGFYGLGISQDNDAMVAEWLKRIIEMANGRQIIITASEGENSVSQRSRMLINLIEKECTSESSNLTKISDGEYAIKTLDGSYSGRISTKFLSDWHGNACIQAFPYLWSKLDLGL